VGKSLVTGLLAVSLRRQGLQVGILDGDITGASIARMFGTHDRPTKAETDERMIAPPRSKGGIRVMSMNMFLENESDPVILRGPMVSNALRQFFDDVDWGALDFLLIDLPPGTSDAPLTVMQALPLDGVVIVSSPQMLATMIVKKCVNMVRHLKGTIIGIVENMSYFETPNGERYELFGPSRGSELVGVTGAPLLGTLPIDPSITTLCDTGRIEEYYSEAYEELVANFVSTLKIDR
jgi:Mrp family chromosome partitioning ATPase